MSTWNSPPQIPPYKEPPFGATAEQQTEGLTAYLKQLANVVSALKNDLEFMLNGNLDVKNIRAKGITADRMDVNELSAISANLGHITAGLIEAVRIFGSYIATSQSYPRCEMSSTGNLFGAYTNANRYLEIYAVNNGAPLIYLADEAGVTRLARNSSVGSLINIGKLILSATGDIEIASTNSGSSVYLEPGNSGYAYVPNWSKLRNNDSKVTLQQELNSKANAFYGSYGTVYVSSAPGGPADIPISFSNGIRTT